LNTDIDIGFVVIWFVVFLLSLSFHEAAHAWTSERFGDDTGRLQGRITLNPVPHIDPIGTILFPLISIFTTVPLLGWAKPVQTNPLLWRDKNRANISVSAAGPISNFILMTIAFIALKMMFGFGLINLNSPAVLPYNVVHAAEGQPAFVEPLVLFLSVALMLNLALGVFNLIPVPPLDGSHVLESLLPPQLADAYDQIRPYGFLLLMAMLYLGVLSYIIMPISRFFWILIIN
jgi:Zn-dependent protease